MAAFNQIDEPQEGDTIVLCLGKELTDEQYERVLQSVIAFMNARWPNPATIGEESN